MRVGLQVQIGGILFQLLSGIRDMFSITGCANKDYSFLKSSHMLEGIGFFVECINYKQS
jgi:hypothetical protein